MCHTRAIPKLRTFGVKLSPLKCCWGYFMLPQTTTKIDFVSSWGGCWYKLLIKSHLVLTALQLTRTLLIIDRVSRVNRLWRQVASDSSLWKDLDLSYGWIISIPKALHFLKASQRLANLRHLCLKGSKRVTPKLIKVGQYALQTIVIWPVWDLHLSELSIACRWLSVSFPTWEVWTCQAVTWSSPKELTL